MIVISQSNKNFLDDSLTNQSSQFSYIFSDMIILQSRSTIDEGVGIILSYSIQKKCLNSYWGKIQEHFSVCHVARKTLVLLGAVGFSNV